jgi:hypothetical protein
MSRMPRSITAKQIPRIAAGGDRAAVEVLSLDLSDAYAVFKR